MTWANAGFLIGGLILGVLALIGFLDAVRGTPIRRVVSVDANLPGVRDEAFHPLMELACRTELESGNEAGIFWNGDQTFPRLWDDLRSAKRSITIQLYYNKPGRMADTLSEILIDRVRAGARVLFLYDAFGSSLEKEYVERLEQAGVRMRKFRPLSPAALNHVNHRAHNRVICIDGRVGWTGGFGIDDKWFGDGRSPEHWRDSNVRFTGPAVAHLQAAFCACWAEATGDLLTGESLYPLDAPKTEGGIVAGLLHASPTVGSTDAERFLTMSIACAREKLYVTNSYFVPDRDLRMLLCAAVGRGVDVRVLTVSDKTDIKSTWYAGRARYEQLLRAGVRIYEYRHTMMHAKTLVIDGHWCAVGSMNVDNRSLSFNEETVLLMLNDGAAATVEKHFMDDLEHADEIRLETFRRRGVWPRVKEKACYAFWRVL